MDIKALLDVGCKTVANMIKGKSPEEIRKRSKSAAKTNGPRSESPLLLIPLTCSLSPY